MGVVVPDKVKFGRRVTCKYEELEPMERAALFHPTQLYREIVACLNRGERVAQGIIVARFGSGPREAGVSMIALEDGRTLGTVGGGALEAKVTEMGGRVLREQSPICQTFSLAGQRVEDGGMICGGDVEILVDFLDAADPICHRIFEQILRDQEARRPSWLVRSMRREGSGCVVRTGLGLLDDEGFDMGSLDMSGVDPDALAEKHRKPEAILISAGDIRYVVQPVDYPETVFLFGAGHIARELAPICGVLGFKVVVIDDRSELANAERFPTVSELLITGSYEESFARPDIDASAYIVIVTHSHAHDKTVLSLSLKTSAAYIGMIASSRKREIIFRSLADEGASEDDLARVHSPIGLEIGARTPAEIAVSIAAELIAVRSRRIS